MSTPKRQHYVPQMILRRFTDESGWLYCCRPVVGRQWPIWRSKSEQVFAENHLYTLAKDQDEFDVSIERDFGVLEGEAAPIIDKIVRAALSGQTPPLGAGERDIWFQYLVLQQRRVPDVSKAVLDAHLDRVIEESVAKIEKDIHRPLTADEMVQFRSRSRTNAGPYFAATPPKDDLLRKLRATSIVTAVIRNEKDSLVCGSRPIAGFEGWFCVHQRVAVRLDPPPGFDRLVFLDTSAEIRRINQDIVNRSTLFAASSRELVESFAPR